MTAGSSRAPPVPVPTPGSPTGCSSRPRRRCRRGRSPWCIPTAACQLPVPRMAGPHGTARPGAVDGREGPFPGQRRRRGVLRQDEDGIRPSRALGGTTPRRGTRLGRRLHPLARPRAHQTVARLDEPGTIPPEPGNGCVIISKKTSAAPYHYVRGMLVILMCVWAIMCIWLTLFPQRTILCECIREDPRPQKRLGVFLMSSRTQMWK